jgi:hypothetical protein
VNSEKSVLVLQMNDIILQSFLGLTANCFEREVVNCVTHLHTAIYVILVSKKSPVSSFKLSRENVKMPGVTFSTILVSYLQPCNRQSCNYTFFYCTSSCTRREKFREVLPLVLARRVPRDMLSKVNSAKNSRVRGLNVSMSHADVSEKLVSSDD